MRCANSTSSGQTEKSVTETDGLRFLQYSRFETGSELDQGSSALKEQSKETQNTYRLANGPIDRVRFGY